MNSHPKESAYSQGETAPSRPAGRGCGRELQHVVLVDPHAVRRTAVQRLLGELPEIDISTCVDAAGVALNEFRGADIALVALGEDVAASQRILGALRRVDRQRVQVIAYGDGTEAWPLRARCQVLLAGAGCVLDSAQPSFAAQLQQRIRQWLDAAERRRREETHLRSVMHALGVVGQSPVMRAVYCWVLKVSALTNLPILITGETGTGKELVAQAIWKLDPKRRERPFIAVNCGSVAGELSESEFFGHERGAFTGADQQRAGLFRAAQGGVLFLDEVAELSESQQVKLLRVLQEGRVRGIGADREVPVDVRVLAATNHDLAERIRQAKFRQDLYQRLRVLHVQLPPLRERPEDLEPLVNHFLSQHANAVRDEPPAVTPEFVQALKQANLPGNVRELENLIRQAVFLREADGPLGLADLPREVLSGLAGAEPAPAFALGIPEGPHAGELLPDPQALLAEHDWNLARAVAHCEKLLLAAALERTRGNQSEAARLLGITSRSVYNKLRRHRGHSG